MLDWVGVLARFLVLALEYTAAVVEHLRSVCRAQLPHGIHRAVTLLFQLREHCALFQSLRLQAYDGAH